MSWLIEDYMPSCHLRQVFGHVRLHCKSFFVLDQLGEVLDRFGVVKGDENPNRWYDWMRYTD